MQDHSSPHLGTWIDLEAHGCRAAQQRSSYRGHSPGHLHSPRRSSTPRDDYYPTQPVSSRGSDDPRLLAEAHPARRVDAGPEIKLGSFASGPGGSLARAARLDEGIGLHGGKRGVVSRDSDDLRGRIVRHSAYDDLNGVVDCLQYPLCLTPSASPQATVRTSRLAAASLRVVAVHE